MARHSDRLFTLQKMASSIRVEASSEALRVRMVTRFPKRLITTGSLRQSRAKADPSGRNAGRTFAYTSS